ncbi:MAG: ABC transporter permease [Verrucomicrobia bacterium]|nr:ABC transporter permease [Verrucomicrobiota bacterium]
MQRILAIMLLTVRAALRYRLVLVLSAILLATVVILPLVIKDDGTARGFTQIILTYTLASISALLGFATLWLSCGTLARDVEEAQIQMVAVKPISRWEIWFGKWLGIVVINAVLVAVSSGAVFFLMKARAQKLPEDQQAILRNEVMVARGGAREPIPNYDEGVRELLKRRIEEATQPITDVEYMRTQIREQLKAREQVVPTDFRRQWEIDLGVARHFLKDKPLYLRVKFNVAEIAKASTYLGIFAVGDVNSAMLYQTNLSLAPDSFHEIEVPPNLVDERGILTVNFLNRNPTALLFTAEEGLEVLYPESTFGVNFFRGITIIFFWLALLAALGLAASSFLSFPVAAFVSLAVLIVAFSSGTLALVLEQGTVLEVNHETGYADKMAWIDYVALPVFKVLLGIINMVLGFSPIDSLSTGRSITWGQLGLAFSQICLLMGGILAGIGITIFNRRELATAQSNH